MNLFKRIMSKITREVQKSQKYSNNLKKYSKKYNKIHLGCGHNILDGWLNTDLFPSYENVYHVDALKTLNFNENQFDFCFNEHMIEHIEINEADILINEIYKILKPGGVLRLSTPNFDFLVKIYQNTIGGIGNEYIKWSKENFCPQHYQEEAIYVVNNFVRDWGHKFIHNYNSIKRLLENAGFTKININEISKSNYRDLKNIDNIKRMPRNFLALESIIVEGNN